MGKYLRYVVTPFGLHVWLITGMLAIAFILSHLLSSAGDRKKSEWVDRSLLVEGKNSELPSSLNIPDANPSGPGSGIGKDSASNTLTGSKSNAADFGRLARQYKDVVSRANHHLLVMLWMKKIYFIQTIEAPVWGAVAAIALFFITKDGWTAVNNYIITVFLAATALFLFYQALPAMFQVEQNANENAKAYVGLIGLGNQMQTYVSTRRDGDGKVVDVATFESSVDKQMAGYRAFYFAIDPSKAPDFKSAFADIQKNAQAGNDDGSKNGTAKNGVAAKPGPGE